MTEDYLLIGIDGGATKVSGWSIKVEEEKQTFTLGDIHVEKSYRDMPDYIEGFQPVELSQQLNELHRNLIQPTAMEQQHGKAYMSAAARVITEIAQQDGAKYVLVGIGMPGLKTRDQRGIAAMNNGPRMIHYCTKVEQLFKESGVQLATPIAKLGSDAFYCGIGEEYAEDGQFRGTRNSYYLGGGTGAADALKLRGELVSLDDIKTWFVKTWEMQNAEGISLEKCASAKGIQSLYADRLGTELETLNQQEIYPPQIRERALQGEKAAVRTFQIITEGLAQLFYERITTLFAGWQGVFGFINPNKPQPAREHPYLGELFDTLIIGQRLGDLFLESKGDNILWKPFFAELSRLILQSSVLDHAAKAHYCPSGRFNETLLRISSLREAPALGAGVDAFLNYRKT